MKVLMVVRDTFNTSPGGDSVQVLMTAKYLRYIGVEVDIELSGNKSIAYEEYDLLHFFNIIRPDDILPHIKSKIPYVISTIFVDYSEFELLGRSGLLGLLFRFISPSQIEYLKSIARFLIKGDKIKSKYYLFFGYKSSIKKVIKKASLLLPNSHSEYKRFETFIGQKCPYKKIVNAIDLQSFKEETKPNEKFKNHIICVGRIEGRKNQLLLIKAINQTNLKLTIIGKCSPNQVRYYQECLAEASKNSNISFIDHISHEELVPIYKAAKVHVLASWFETTGLSSLEAAAMGCNVVLTKKGDTEEYFRNLAYYCEPNDIESIKIAIESAFKEDVDASLREYVNKKYSWENTAKQTYNAYLSVLNS